MSEIYSKDFIGEEESCDGSSSDAFLEFEVDEEAERGDDVAEIAPYMFEPQPKPGKEGPISRLEVDKGPLSVGQQVDDWCSCGHCQPQKSRKENICCCSIPIVLKKLHEREGEPLTCITDHPGFSAVCTNVWTLKTAWNYYKQQYEDVYEGPRHKKFRHIAYRQMVQWVWHYLGRHVRVVLPSCAVSCIRAHFPPPGNEEEFTFEGSKLPDI